MARVVILGAGVAGHTAALHAKRMLGKGNEISVISPNSKYNWIPSNIWVGVGRMSAEKVTFPLAPVYKKQGITFLAGRRVESVDYSTDAVKAHLDDGTAVEAELLLVSVGRRAQTRGIGLENAGVAIDERDHIEVDSFLRTANPKIWAAGDCIGGLQLAHLGSAEGGRAVENALGHDVMPMDRTVVPSCIYTYPEIAMVGLNPEAAKAAGIELKIGQARYLGNGKALGEGEPDGLTQLYADAATDRLVGATVMGVHAVEIIHEVGVAISDGLSMDDLGSIIHAHPTVSELMMDAAEQAEGIAPYLS